MDSFCNKENDARPLEHPAKTVSDDSFTTPNPQCQRSVLHEIDTVTNERSLTADLTTSFRQDHKEILFVDIQENTTLDYVSPNTSFDPLSACNGAEDAGDGINAKHSTVINSTFEEDLFYSIEYIPENRMGVDDPVLEELTSSTQNLETVAAIEVQSQSNVTSDDGESCMILNDYDSMLINNVSCHQNLGELHNATETYNKTFNCSVEIGNGAEAVVQTEISEQLNLTYGNCPNKNQDFTNKVGAFGDTSRLQLQSNLTLEPETDLSICSEKNCSSIQLNQTLDDVLGMKSQPAIMLKNDNDESFEGLEKQANLKFEDADIPGNFNKTHNDNFDCSYIRTDTAGNIIQSEISDPFDETSTKFLTQDLNHVSKEKTIGSTADLQLQLNFECESTDLKSAVTDYPSSAQLNKSVVFESPIYSNIEEVSNSISELSYNIHNNLEEMARDISYPKIQDNLSIVADATFDEQALRVVNPINTSFSMEHIDDVKVDNAVPVNNVSQIYDQMLNVPKEEHFDHKQDELNGKINSFCQLSLKEEGILEEDFAGVSRFKPEHNESASVKFQETLKSDELHLKSQTETNDYEICDPREKYKADNVTTERNVESECEVDSKQITPREEINMYNVNLEQNTSIQEVMFPYNNDITKHQPNSEIRSKQVIEASLNAEPILFDIFDNFTTLQNKEKGELSKIQSVEREQATIIEKCLFHLTEKNQRTLAHNDINVQQNINFLESDTSQEKESTDTLCPPIEFTGKTEGSQDLELLETSSKVANITVENPSLATLPYRMPSVFELDTYVKPPSRVIRDTETETLSHKDSDTVHVNKGFVMAEPSVETEFQKLSVTSELQSTVNVDSDNGPTDYSSRNNVENDMNETESKLPMESIFPKHNKDELDEANACTIPNIKNDSASTKSLEALSNTLSQTIDVEESAIATDTELSGNTSDTTLGSAGEGIDDFQGRKNFLDIGFQSYSQEDASSNSKTFEVNSAPLKQNINLQVDQSSNINCSDQVVQEINAVSHKIHCRPNIRSMRHKTQVIENPILVNAVVEKISASEPSTIVNDADRESTLDRCKQKEEFLNKEIGRLQEELESITKDNMVKDRCILSHALAREANKDIILKYKNIMDQYQNFINKQSRDLVEIRLKFEQLEKDFSNTEMAFAAVFHKYERAKSVMGAFKKNEEILNENIEHVENQLAYLDEKYNKRQEKYNEIVKKAHERINQEREANRSKLVGLQTTVKRLEIKSSSLETALKQKTEECQALAALCEDIGGK